MSIKTYSELITLPTFEQRYEYLRLGGTIGEETFGCDRWLNQVFYKTREWKDFRRNIIVRDMGCDLGISDREIHGIILIHHINPISINDIRNRRLDVILNPENAICTSHNTHNAIHYGDDSLLVKVPIARSRNDTCPWRQT
jgi:hypothetical protein